jgi:AbrB family looped-hinge helix DNA binding protein
VTSRGQVTIPKSIREKLGLSPGAEVEFVFRDGELVVVPKLEDPEASLRKLKEDVSISKEELERMIKDSKEDWRK